jgi:hypothetical protein
MKEHIKIIQIQVALQPLVLDTSILSSQPTSQEKLYSQTLNLLLPKTIAKIQCYLRRGLRQK